MCPVPLRLYQKGARMSVKGSIEQWLIYIERHKARNTHSSYKQILWRAAEAVPAELQNIRQEHIENFLYGLKGLGNSSINAYLFAIRSFFSWASGVYDLPNPAKNIEKLPTPPPKQRILSETEYSQVLAVCVPNEKAIVEFMAHSGLRCCEILSLSESNLSPDGRLLQVLGKGNKHRYIPLNQTALFHFITVIKLLKSRNRLWLYKLCQQLSRRARIEPFSPHSLRHYFITRLAKKNISLYKISKIAGHSNVLVTQKIYTHLFAEDFTGVTDVLDD